MRSRTLMIAALIAIPALTSGQSQAVTTTTSMNANLSRQQIRDMPLMTRPSRPGHFYGNTVRRVRTR